jgi:hypothetical protein
LLATGAELEAGGLTEEGLADGCDGGVATGVVDAVGLALELGEGVGVGEPPEQEEAKIMMLKPETTIRFKKFLDSISLIPHLHCVPGIILTHFAVSRQSETLRLCCLPYRQFSVKLY